MPTLTAPFSPLLLLPLLLLTLVAMQAHAAHITCSQKLGKAPPAQYGYRNWCTANIVNNSTSSSSAEYKCRQGGAKVVADWGKRGAQVFEWHSPCGAEPEGGYGKKANGQCLSDSWALCHGDGFDACLWMNAKDDCQWPDLILSEGVPKSVSLWYY